MVIPFLLAALVFQDPQQPPSPIKKLVVTPSPAVMTAQDTLRLQARALDANGQPVPDVVFRFLAAGSARFEGRVDQDGLVRSGATGTLPVTVSAVLPNYAPYREVIEVRMVPAAAGRIELEQPVRKLLVGQEVQLAARVYSIHGEPRSDAIAWKTSSTAARVTDGKLTGARPGKVTVTASVASANASFDVDVVASANLGSIRLTPSASTANTGDVIRFKLDVRDRANAAIPV
jgi:hypothetical protein